MRISRGIILALILGATPVAAPLFAFDGAPATSQDAAMPLVTGQAGAVTTSKKATAPSAPQAAIVANAFVALGRYYLSGIPNSKIKSDPDRAREMFSYAASYFGNADAQYDLARLYLRGVGSSRDDFRYGARWLGLAAQKGQHQAQAMLGQMLFNGDQLPRQAARGLMWLTLARDSAAPDETWIKESYSKAIAKASDEDRAMALQMLEHWVQGRP